MAKANPAMTTPQVSVTYIKEKRLGGKSGAFMKTHYNQTLKQADRSGVVRLDNEGRIASVDEGVTINIPATLYPEDIYTLAMLGDIADVSEEEKV